MASEIVSPFDRVSHALGDLVQARVGYRHRPAVEHELDNVLSRLGTIRRALLVTDGHGHGMSIVSESLGVQARCRCGWESAYQAGTGRDRQVAYERAEHEGRAHLEGKQ
jgi:hypothetical protein